LRKIALRTRHEALKISRQLVDRVGGLFKKA
jgi:hypothetical protein